MNERMHKWKMLLIIMIISKLQPYLKNHKCKRKRKEHVKYNSITIQVKNSADDTQGPNTE